MGQYAKGLDTTQERRKEILKSLESVKHYLWHGNVVRARDKLEDLHGILDHGGIAGESSQKLRKALDEFGFPKSSRCNGRRKVRIWCFKCALRCLMNAWKIPFVTGIRTS
jgi:hypothetical protein